MLLFITIVSDELYGQIGGQHSFEFLNIPIAPRPSALGGINVSLAEEDLNLVYNNPALTSDTLSGIAAFNYLSYFADVNSVSFVYQHDFKALGPFYIGVNHFSYGEIEGTDATGQLIDGFDAGETVVYIGKSHRINTFSLGTSLKFINSSIAGFSATALALDIGGSFIHPDKRFTAGLVFKNVGLVLSDYDVRDSELPFDIQLGTSFKPEHMPFRFSVTAYNLFQGDITYFNSNDEEGPGTADKIFRHFTIAAELLLSEVVNFRVGYNHLVRKELKLDNAGGSAGFSYGVMFKIRSVEFSYGRGGYHPAGGAHNFGLVVNTNSFLRKR